MTDIQYIPKPREDVIFQNIEGETVILDNSSGLIHQLNPTASFIWQHCDASNSIETIANILVQSYSVSIEDAIKDVSEVVMNFKDNNLLIE